MDYLQQLFCEVTFMTPSLGAVFAGIIAVLLLAFSGFASGSEIAFFSLSPNDLNELEESNDERDKLILELSEDSERTLATILIANNLINGGEVEDLLGQCVTCHGCVKYVLRGDLLGNEVAQ